MVDLKLELVVVPVSDVDKAKAFYEKVGFHVDVDHAAGDAFRIVQLTPPGSACSITIGTGMPQAEPGSYQGLHLVVEDLPTAHAELRRRGVRVDEPFHMGAGGQEPGLDPDRRPYGSFAMFADPDGNTWLVQEVGDRSAPTG